jgi:hypothetical protein
MPRGPTVAVEHLDRPERAVTDEHWSSAQHRLVGGHDPPSARTSPSASPSVRPRSLPVSVMWAGYHETALPATMSILYFRNG